MRSTSWTSRAAGLVIGMLASATLAAGQPRPGRPPGPRPGGTPGAEVREAMDQMVLARMKVALRLSPEQEEKIVPRMRELMQVRRDQAAQRRLALARLRVLVLDGTAGYREIAQALRAVRAGDDEFRAREAGLRGAIDRELTPRQQARMVFFEARLRRMMQRRLQEAMAGEGRPGPGGQPGDDEDSGPPEGGL